MAAAKEQAPRLRISRKELESGRIPWHVRLKAWWDGYDIRVRRKGGKAARTSHDVRAPEDRKPWTDERIGLVQQLWGDGFDRPGGKEMTIELVKPLGLDPSMTVLDLGAGLGGGTRAICKAFDVWITGIEEDATLAQVGHELSNIAGIGRKAPIYNESLEDLELKERGYDCVFSKETLFTVKDKTRLLREVERGLKPGGHLVFTDYILADLRTQSKELQAWKESEGITPSLWSVTDYRELLKELHLDIRIAENLTPRMVKIMKQGWTAFMQRAQESGKIKEIGDLVMREAETSMQRLHLLETGELMVYRFHALKKHEGRLLSDW